MKLTKKKMRKPGVELNLTSMIDVIFLLLNFFLVNVGFSRSERELQATLRGQAAAGKGGRQDGGQAGVRGEDGGGGEGEGEGEGGVDEVGRAGG